MLPESKATNMMAGEIAKLVEKGIDAPFVHIPVTNFTPEWHLDKTMHGYLLQPNLLNPSLMRWALAAQATGMLPLSAGLAHMDICMRVAAEAKHKNRYSTSASAYDELLQSRTAELCLKGVDGFDPTAVFTKLDKEVMEQAFEVAEKRMKNGSAEHHGHKAGWTKWQDKGNWKNNDSRGASNAWQQYGQTKRPYDHGSKSWDNKKRKF